MKLCWLEITDKASGNRESQKLVLAILEKPILDPCRKGAAIYECAITPEYARRNLAEVGTGAVSTTLYATAGLALEAAFAKTTLRSMQSLLRGVTAQLSSSLGTGAACAAADGPLPICDALGVTLAIGGTVLSLHDLRAVQSKLPDALATALRHSVDLSCQSRLPVLHLKPRSDYGKITENGFSVRHLILSLTSRHSREES